MLSDVYSPTIDNTNVETLQYVVTDGQTFTDLQTRDMTYTVRSTDESGMACRVTSTAKSGKYRLVTDYVTDPDRDAVVASTRLEPAKGTKDLKVYVRYDATINGNGGGGSSNGGADDAVVDAATTALVSSDPDTETNAANRDYAVPLYGALRADRPFLEASSGYAGTASDGLAQLDADHSLATTYDEALDGNVVQTGQVDVGKDGRFTLALGFGTTKAQAIDVAGKSAHAPFDRTKTAYEKTWQQLRQGSERAAEDLPGTDQAGGRPAPVGVLAVGQRAEGQRGQDLPRRRGRLPRQPVGAGGQRGRHPGWQARLLRLLPRGVRARPLRVVHRPDGRR